MKGQILGEAERFGGCDDAASSQKELKEYKTGNRYDRPQQRDHQS